MLIEITANNTIDGGALFWRQEVPDHAIPRTGDHILFYEDEHYEVAWNAIVDIVEWRYEKDGVYVYVDCVDAECECLITREQWLASLNEGKE